MGHVRGLHAESQLGWAAITDPSFAASSACVVPASPCRPLACTACLAHSAAPALQGWQLAYFVVAGIGALTCALVVLGVAEPRSASGVGLRTALRGGARSLLRDVWAVLRVRRCARRLAVRRG